MGLEQVGHAVELGLAGGREGDARGHERLPPAAAHLAEEGGPEAILREAGGRMTGVSNTPLRYDTEELRNLNGIVVTNGVIHDRVIEVTQAVLAGF